MAIGSSNRTSLRWIREATEGTTPATPALNELKFTGENLGFNIATNRSNEIRADRNVSDLIRVGADSGGEINGEMSAATYDDFIESVLCGTWTANVIKNGITIAGRSYTLQRHFQDAGATGIFNQFRGSRADTWDLEVQQGQVVTTKFGFKSRSMDVTEAQIAGATFVAANANNVMSSVSNIAAIKENTVTSTEFFRKLSLSIKNNLRQLTAIGTLGSVGMSYGTCEITGSLEIYFATVTMLNRYLNATSFSLSFDMVDGAKTYTVLLPKVKFESGSVSAGGLDQDIMYTGNIRALYDATEVAQIKITRVP